MSRLAGPIALPSLESTADLAAGIARILMPGDVLLLAGPIGVGKTAFARAFIQSRLGRMEDVPSPTYTLVQVYDAPEQGPLPACQIWHSDLYRLGGPDEAVELGLEEAFTTAICLVEWPDRLAELAPADALTLTFDAGEDGHDVTLSGPSDWTPRLEAVLA